MEFGWDAVVSTPRVPQPAEGAHVGQWCTIMSDTEDQEEGIMEDISEVIPREFLNCSLCNEEFHKPKLLPCLHSFCHRCIQHHLHQQQQQQGHPGDTIHTVTTTTNTSTSTTTATTASNAVSSHTKSFLHSFSCPECGTQVEMTDPEHLPDNVLARRLSCPSLPTTPRDSPLLTCAPCLQQGRGEITAAVHCANCEENLCHICAHTHAQQVETSSHKVEPLAIRKDHSGNSAGMGGGGGQEDGAENGGGGVEGPSGVGGISRMDSGEAGSGTLRRCCDCYDAYDIDSTYCVDCELALCADCRESHDPSHRTAELSAIAQNFTTKIQEPVEELKQDSLTLTRMLSNLDRAERYAAKQQRDVLSGVRRRTRVLVGLIRDYESMLMQEVERRHQQNVHAIHQRRLAANQHAASITAVIDLTDKLLQFGSEEEKVALRRKVGRRVRELCESDLPSDPLEMTNLRLFEPSVTVETICDLFGELRTDLVQPGGVRKRATLTSSLSVDSARTNSLSESVDDNLTELTQLEEEQEEEEEAGEEGSQDSSLLSNSDRSERLQAERRKAMQAAQSKGAAPRRRHHSDSSNSSLKDHTPRRPRSKTTPNGLEDRTVSYKDKDAGGLLDSSIASVGGEDSRADQSNSSFQSSGSGSGSAQDSVPTQLLEAPHKDLVLPDVIARDSIKGVGVNAGGDIVVATMGATAHGSAIYILEQHGIVRGQVPIAAGPSTNWSVHSVAADGRVALIIPRGDNRYKVKVMSEDCTGKVLVDVHLESLGLNFATATSCGHLLVASNRYATLSSLGGRAAKTGGNISIYDNSGRLERRLTNADLAPKGGQHHPHHNTPRLLEKPHWLSVDSSNNIFVADSATHCVLGVSWQGQLLFSLGNADTEDLYQGPDTVCADRAGHVIVTDKKEGRIDLLNYQGQLLRCLFPSDPIKFVCATPNQLLAVLPTQGSIKFYHYL